MFKRCSSSKTLFQKDVKNIHLTLFCICVIIEQHRQLAILFFVTIGCTFFLVIALLFCLLAWIWVPNAGFFVIMFKFHKPITNFHYSKLTFISLGLRTGGFFVKTALCWKSTGDEWISPHKGWVMQKATLRHAVIMQASSANIMSTGWRH